MGDYITEFIAIILFIIIFLMLSASLKQDFQGSAIMDNMQLIKEYRQADFKRRLHMFLEYRSLRSQFSEIDQKEMPVMFPNLLKPQQKIFKLSGSFRFFLPWAGDLLKRHCFFLSNKWELKLDAKGGKWLMIDYPGLIISSLKML